MNITLSKDFERNAQLLSESIPLLSLYLGQCGDDFDFCRTEEKELNLYNQSQKRYIHAEKGALREVVECLRVKKISDKEVLFVYGLGLGYVYLAAKNWLGMSHKHRLIFIEDDLSVMKRFLETNIASEILKHSQVEICFAGDEKENLFIKLAWETLFQPFETLLLPSYAARKNSVDGYELFLSSLRGVHLVGSDVQDLGVRVLSNLSKNLRSESMTRDIRDLKECFFDLPILVCGAGPSLERQIHEIKRYQNSLIILAGGSAIPVLTRYGIQPDFCVSYDPDPPYARFISHSAFDRPFITLPRFSHDLLRLIHGPKFIVSSGEGQPFETAFSSSDSSMDAGWTVSNFCVSLANFFGGNPILLAGMDLGYSNSQKYTSMINSQQAPQEKEAIGKDLMGNALRTRTDLMMSKEWFEHSAAKNPQKSWINTSPNGLKIGGFEHKALHEVSFSPFDKEGLLHQFVVAASTIPLEPTCKKLDRFTTSLAKCLTLTEGYLSKSETRALFEVEIEHEWAYQILLQPIWDVWKWVFMREKTDMQVQRFAFFRSICISHLGAQYEKNL